MGAGSSLNASARPSGILEVLIMKWVGVFEVYTNVSFTLPGSHCSVRVPAFAKAPAWQARFGSGFKGSQSMFRPLIRRLLGSIGRAMNQPLVDDMRAQRKALISRVKEGEERLVKAI